MHRMTEKAIAQTPEAIQKLMELVIRLRDPVNGCPWDRVQTMQTIVPHTIEEAYEVAEAVEVGHIPALIEELGDLLFQVIFYAQLGREQGTFDLKDIAQAMADKLIRRHPHIFGDADPADSPASSLAAWERHKIAEKQGQKGSQDPISLLADVSTALPAMTRALKLQRRAASVGFDWPTVEGVWEKFDEERQELQQAIQENQDEGHNSHRDAIEAELGDLLFVCVNLARHLGLNPENALRGANHRFTTRFQAMESIAQEPLQNLSPEIWDLLWEKAKKSVS